MSALQVAGGSLVGFGGRAPGTPTRSQMRQVSLPTIGVRALRGDYLKPGAVNNIPRNLKIIEDLVERDAAVLDPVASEERLTLPRFQHLFQGSELLPPTVFIQALDLGANELINGNKLPYDADVLALRDDLVLTYKPLEAKIRQLHAREIEAIPQHVLQNFAVAWTDFESAWLQNREAHAVEALQPLSKAILSLEALLRSLEKERLLAWPRVQHQKVVTLKCLEGFIHSLAELSAGILPALSRELDHDPRLLLMMDHVLSLRGENPAPNTFVGGISATPMVTFPDHQVRPRGSSGPARSFSTGALTNGSGGGPHDKKHLTLDVYAFRLLGASVGDAAAAGKLKAETGNGQAGRAKLAMTGSITDATTLHGLGLTHETAAGGAKESKMSRRSKVHATGLLGAFEDIKDFLLGLKTTLQHIDPQLDQDEDFVEVLRRFDRAYRRSKRLFLEPENLV